MTELTVEQAKKQGAIEALETVRLLGLAMGTIAGVNDPEAGKGIFKLVSDIVDQVSINYKDNRA
ncbi:hypothetical protein [Enterobacter hormaechei]|uniref:hypothetical protein n=1 Tax=Enterobacter hormaechei TaxID=158836 RepID=UPI002FF035D9